MVAFSQVRARPSDYVSPWGDSMANSRKYFVYTFLTAQSAFACASGERGSSSGLPSCSKVCVDMVAAQCPKGPVSQSTCETQCQERRSGPCKSEDAAVAECAGSHPSYKCDVAVGDAVPVGCDDENAALVSCLIGS